MSKEGKKHRGYWKRLIAAALCASITVTTVFPDNGVAFAARSGGRGSHRRNESCK